MGTMTELLELEEFDSEYFVHWIDGDGAAITYRIENRAKALECAASHEGAYIERRTYFYE